MRTGSSLPGGGKAEKVRQQKKVVKGLESKKKSWGNLKLAGKEKTRICTTWGKVKQKKRVRKRGGVGKKAMKKKGGGSSPGGEKGNSKGAIGSRNQRAKTPVGRTGKKKRSTRLFGKRQDQRYSGRGRKSYNQRKTRTDLGNLPARWMGEGGATVMSPQRKTDILKKSGVEAAGRGLGGMAGKGQRVTGKGERRGPSTEKGGKKREKVTARNTSCHTGGTNVVKERYIPTITGSQQKRKTDCAGSW